ncbi:MAG: hypothetical protein U9N30_01580 [Campylobacterota bacterium]|nr:hypothetical protein [Campylobacterota bacterium]
MAKLNTTVRTCVVCRKKIEQQQLHRLRCVDKKLVPFKHDGRSFYICTLCIHEEKKLHKALKQQCRNNDDYVHQLKEIIEYVR